MSESEEESVDEYFEIVDMEEKIDPSGDDVNAVCAWG